MIKRVCVRMCEYASIETVPARDLSTGGIQCDSSSWLVGNDTASPRPQVNRTSSSTINFGAATGVRIENNAAQITPTP